MMLSTFFYALLNLCVKKLSHIPSLELIFFRSTISFVFCISMLLYQGQSIFGNHKKWLLIRGFAGVMALWTYFSTIQKMPLASAVTIQYLSPVFTAMLAFFILKEKMGRGQWVYFLLSLLGVFLMKGFDERIPLLYVGIGIASALFSALAYNAVRKLNTSEHPLVIILYFPMVALPITGLYSWFNWVAPVGIEWFYALAMGIFTQLGQFYMTKAIQTEALANITYLNYLGILYAFLLGYVFFDESFHTLVIVGMLLVMSGVFLNLRKVSKNGA